MFTFPCQDGRGITALTPPPVLPWPLLRRPSPSNQTMSGPLPPLTGMVVPPTASTYSLGGGEVGVGVPVHVGVARAVVARGDADRDAEHRGVLERFVHLLDRRLGPDVGLLGEPQLIDTTPGLFTWSWFAASRAAIHPCSPHSAK